MYIKGCPEEYRHYFTHEHDAAIAGNIEKAIAKRISPSQTEIKSESERSLRYEFQNQYDFRIIVERDYGPGNIEIAFRLDIGQGMMNEDSDQIAALAIKEKSALILPYNYKYPTKDSGHSLPYQKEESGTLAVYAICRNAPAADMGRVLAELVAATYVKATENYDGHVFQVSTKPFSYSRPYKH